MLKHWHRFPRKFGITILGDIQNSMGQGPEQVLDSDLQMSLPTSTTLWFCEQDLPIPWAQNSLLPKCVWLLQQMFHKQHQVIPTTPSLLWFLVWNLLTDNACSLRKAHIGEEDSTSSLMRTTDTISPQCWDFMLPSSFKAGGKLGVPTSIFCNPGDTSGGSFSEMLGHADLCRGSMDMCQPHQCLLRASSKNQYFWARPSKGKCFMIFYGKSKPKQETYVAKYCFEYHVSIPHLFLT